MKETTSEPKVIHIEDYRPPTHLVDAVALDFDIRDGETIVTARVAYRTNPDAQTPADVLDLHGLDVELVEVAIDGVTLDDDAWERTGTGLSVRAGRDAFRLDVVTRIRPETNTALEGLYRSGSCYCTQMEAEGFRRVTFFPDRPDILAPWRVRIEADRATCPVLLSNGNRIDAGDLDDGRHFAVWEDPHRKPCYLFALVAGDLACVPGSFTTRSGRDVRLELWVEHGDEARCAHALDSLQRSMAWDEERFGREYDLDIYMIVAVHDFNAGAMENKGLNIFNSALVLAEPASATDADYQRIEGVIAHEYFHNWSGNRVTCRDWFQLSLKEGFTVFRDQEFTSDVHSRAVKRIEDVRLLRAAQFPEDAGPMAHPVQPRSFIKIDNFYTTTVYEKGAEVIRMMERIVGWDAFRRGSDRYFETHDGCAVTCQDFVNAIESASSEDLGVFRRWYLQAGTPEVRARWKHDAGARTLTLELSQSCPPTSGQAAKEAFHIPVAMGLIGADGQDLPLSMKGDDAAPTERVLHLAAPGATFVFEGFDEAPVPSLLRGFSAPVKLVVDEPEANLLFRLAHDSDAFNRWEAAQRLGLARVLERVEDPERPLDDAYLDAIGRLIDDRQADASFIAEALVLPSESWVGDQMEVVDVDGIHVARRAVLTGLARRHESRLVARWESLAPTGPYAPEPAQMGPRRLRNVCMAWLAALEDDAHVDRAWRQFEVADSMTDVMAALASLSDIEHPRRTEALAAFEERWRDDTLVMNKWFAVQASSRLPGTLAEVERLAQHEAFDAGNPNRVRSLFGVFARNAIHFHARDGGGYRFLADRLIELDARNPQLGGRFAGLFNERRRFDAARQALMTTELQRVLTTEGLSPNAFEVIQRNLDTA